MENNYFNLEEGDKLVGCAGGKNFAVVLSQQGKIYATGYVFYRHFSACRHNTQNNEDYPFILNMPDTWKAKQIWASEKHYVMWVTGQDTDGVMKTFGGGEATDYIGHNEDSCCNLFKPLALPAGTYLKKITNERHIVHGVDNNGNLWVWGSEIYGTEEDRATLYEGEYERNSKPKLMKWFRDQNLKVLDVESGDKAAIVKCEDKDGKVIFYGLTHDADYHKSIGGSTGMELLFKQIISKLEVDGSRVEDFAMGKSACYFLMAADNQETPSIDPERPAAKGLIHFYQTPAADVRGKQWHFVTAEEYEAKKNTLPDICFATRHSMQSFLERVKRSRAGNATEADLNDTSLPNFASMLEDLEFAAAATEHAQKTSNSEASISSSDPLYYSYHTINEQEQKIFATESEAMSGEETWDLNPTIFYRVKKPISSIDKLPLIDLTKHFKQAETNESMSFLVRDDQLKQSEIDAVQITDENTIKRFDDIIKFTNQQDSELLKLIDDLVQEKKSKIEDLKFSMMSFKKEELKVGSTLHEIDEWTIKMRIRFLFTYCKAFSRAVKYISVDERNVAGTISQQHFASKNMVIASVINAIVDKQLSSLPNGETHEIRVNRRKAFEFIEEGNVDHEGKYSIFGQIMQQLKTLTPDMSNFRKNSMDERCYRIKFLGEGSIDAGGPFRDSLVNVVEEMEAGNLPLLIKSPNNKNDHGTNRDCFMLNPSSTSPAHLEMFKYVGGFIAFGILSKSPVPFNFAPTVWKQILDERMNLSDLESVDAYSS